MTRHVYIRLTIDATTTNPEELVRAAIAALAWYKENGVPEGVDRSNVKAGGATVGTMSIHNNRKD